MAVEKIMSIYKSACKVLGDMADSVYSINRSWEERFNAPEIALEDVECPERYPRRHPAD